MPPVGLAEDIAKDVQGFTTPFWALHACPNGAGSAASAGAAKTSASATPPSARPLLTRDTLRRAHAPRGSYASRLSGTIAPVPSTVYQTGWIGTWNSPVACTR